MCVQITILQDSNLSSAIGILIGQQEGMIEVESSYLCHPCIHFPSSVSRIPFFLSEVTLHHSQSPEYR